MKLIGSCDSMGEIAAVSSCLGIRSGNDGKSMGRCNSRSWYDEISEAHLWILNGQCEYFSTIYKQIKTHSILRFLLQNERLFFNDFKDSVLTTLPHIGHFMAALTCGLLVDHVRESKIVSTTTARKLVVYTGTYSLNSNNLLIIMNS